MNSAIMVCWFECSVSQLPSVGSVMSDTTDLMPGGVHD